MVNPAGNANLPIGVKNKLATQECGDPSNAPRWHSRGYLPHFESNDVIQHVTFHLADSLPKDVLENLEFQLRSLPKEKQDIERHKRIEAWMDAGHGSCELRDPRIAEMVQNAFLAFDGKRYRLFAWVVMPNHVHTLFQPMDGWTVAKTVASWKKFTARKINDHRKLSGTASGNANLLIGVENKSATRECGVPSETPSYYFGEYPPDFFDFIVVDECHRGGANDESNWRGILDYFAPAVQLGLTATPKRTENVDTYEYFGEPVYIYSLKEGINDGFLTPFKVKQISTTLDEYVYTPDDQLIEGEIEEGRRYAEPDFNRKIVIEEREKKRVDIFMNEIDQNEKTIVFCATQDHALAVRDYINQIKKSKHSDYCVRVTADEGLRGEQFLRDFQDNELAIPTILTTSQKLSTGVDARNIRNIVLMRPINSMIEFKQIIGRGTRLYDGKDYFTIYDFVKAHQHFNDPEWDGEPIEPEPREPREPRGEKPEPPIPPGPPMPARKIKVKLADGKERKIQHMMATSFWHPDGTPMSAQQFMEMLFGKLPEFFKDEAELRLLWSSPDTRAKLLQGLQEKGFGPSQLAEMQKIIDAEKSDLFDVLAHVAYALPPLTREERASRAKTVIQSRYANKQKIFLEFVLAQYVQEGVQELDREKLAPLLKLKYNNSINDAINDLGDADAVGKMFAGFQKYLYQDVA